MTLNTIVSILVCIWFIAVIVLSILNIIEDIKISRIFKRILKK